MPPVDSFSPYTTLDTVPDWPNFPDKEVQAPKGSETCSKPVRLADEFRRRVYGEELRHSPSHTYAGESSIYVAPRHRNSEVASLTSLAYVDNLKPDIFTFSVTVSPDHQGLTLPSLSFQSFLKFPIGNRSESPAHRAITFYLYTKQI